MNKIKIEDSAHYKDSPCKRANILNNDPGPQIFINRKQLIIQFNDQAVDLKKQQG
jgi:hypothetical protein